MDKRGTIFTILVFLVLLSAQIACAGTGTLRGTFKYKNPATGLEQNLNYGYVYLHSVSKPPPMEKFFSKADQVLGTTFGAPFTISNVPEGTYYIRLVQRKLSGKSQYGPPEEGDYTWFQTAPITITAGAVLDLGVKYATPFTNAPIRVTGTITSATGAPLAGRYVRAQTEPCIEDGINYNINQCGPTKYLAQQPTDVNGRYTLYLKDAGTYYIYTSTCLTTAHTQYSGNRCPAYAGPGPLTLSVGDNKTLNFTAR